jgi:Leucine-rich repeat (LRR) protein
MNSSPPKDETIVDSPNPSPINEELPSKNDVTASDLPLDWTHLGVKADDAMPLRFPHDVAEWSMDDLDICIVGTAGQKITQLPKDFYTQCNPQLETLVIRSHMISVMQGLEGLKQLDTLELYDNQVQALDCLEGPGQSLRILDMSYNAIRDMAPVRLCSNLQELCTYCCYYHHSPTPLHFTSRHLFS